MNAPIKRGLVAGRRFNSVACVSPQCPFQHVDNSPYCGIHGGSLGSPATYLPPYDERHMPEVGPPCDAAIERLEAIERMLAVVISHGGEKDKALLARVIAVRRELEAYEPDAPYCRFCGRHEDSCWDNPDGCEGGEAAHDDAGDLRIWNQATTEPREDL